MMNTAKAAADEWSRTLCEETDLLSELLELTSESRRLAGRPDSDAFRGSLARQAEIVRELERRRGERSDWLRAERRPASDFLHLALSATPPSEQAELLDVFQRFVDKAERVAREIEINRRFFRAALSTVNGTINDVMQSASGGARTYDAAGVKSSESTALCFNTVT